MKTAAAKQAPKERGSEKRLSASWTFPICKTGREEEVANKRQSEKESRNKEGESDFEHRSDKKPKNHEPEPAVRAPGRSVFRINPGSVRLVRALLQTIQDLQTNCRLRSGKL